MNSKGWMMMRVLMNRFHPNGLETLIKYLSPEGKKALTQKEISSADLSPLLQPPKIELEKIHYSWIEKALQSLPPFWKPLAISSLSSEQIQGLQKGPPEALSNQAKVFIQNKLFRLLKLDQFTPLEYLPSSDFLPLIKWNKSEVLDLIDYLGLYDLASEVRQIVNRNDLKNIYASLNHKQFYFLKKCLHQKDKITSPKLVINPSNIDRKKLKKTLHLRGLSRLGRAFTEEPYDFVWLFAHQLDSGRGTILLNHFKHKTDPKITHLLKQQVITIINFMKSG